MTYNIRNGRGSDGVVDLARTAGVIESYRPDVVALQEVDAGRARSGTVEQATELAVRLGMSASYAACIEVGDERYGIAILCRLPLTDTRQLQLPHHGAHRRAEPRCALVTRLAWAGTEVTVVNTHLSVQLDERGDQVEALVEAGRDTALIIAGDFHCRRCSDASILYRAPLEVVHAGTWSGGGARHVSDHLPVVAELELTTDARRDAA